MLESERQTPRTSRQAEVLSRGILHSYSHEGANRPSPEKDGAYANSNPRVRRITHATCRGQGCEGCNFAKIIWAPREKPENRAEPKRMTIDYLTSHPDQAREMFRQPGRQLLLVSQDRLTAVVVTLSSDQASALLTSKPNGIRPTETYTFDTFTRFPHEIVNRLTQRATSGYIIAGDILAKLMPYKPMTRR